MRTLLFYGELPPDTVHGISYSSMINLDMLSNYFNIQIVEEKSMLRRNGFTSFTKIYRIFRDIFKISCIARTVELEYFYLTLSLSIMGSLKTLLAIICFSCFNKGKKVLHIHRGDFFDTFKGNAIKRLIFKKIINRVDRVILLEEIQKTQFAEFFDKPVYVLHNTVETENDFPVIKRGNKSFLFISNYLPDKGIFILLEIFSSNSDFVTGTILTTYGDFPDKKTKERIMSYANHSIIIHERITGNAKFNEISKSDCLILPSLNEGVPLIILEAMSLGVPVISTRTGLIPEMLGEDYPFLALPGDKESLKSKINEFIICKNLDFISKNLKKRYLAKYSKENHFIELKRIFT